MFSEDQSTISESNSKNFSSKKKCHKHCSAHFSESRSKCCHLDESCNCLDYSTSESVALSTPCLENDLVSLCDCKHEKPKTPKPCFIKKYEPVGVYGGGNNGRGPRQRPLHEKGAIGFHICCGGLGNDNVNFAHGCCPRNTFRNSTFMGPVPVSKKIAGSTYACPKLPNC